MCLSAVITTWCADDTDFFVLYQNNTNKTNPPITDRALKRSMRGCSVEPFNVSGEQKKAMQLIIYLRVIQRLIRHNPSPGDPAFSWGFGPSDLPTSDSLGFMGFHAIWNDMKAEGSTTGWVNYTAQPVWKEKLKGGFITVGKCPHGKDATGT